MEQMFRRLEGISLTVINVGWFADNYFMVLRDAAQLGFYPMPLGDPDTAKDAPPSNEDIAAVNVETLIDPDTHGGKVYRPTGPSLISPGQIVDTLSRVLGRPISYRPASEAMLSKALTADGWPIALQSQLRHYLEEYRRGTFAIGGPTDVIPNLLGRQAEAFEAIAQRYVAARTEARRSITSRLAALARVGRMVLTPAIDYDAAEHRLNHAILRSPEFAQANPLWQRMATRHADPSDDRPQTIADPMIPAA